MLDELQSKTISNHVITTCDVAVNLHQILQKLKALNITYDINPQYPHVVARYRGLDEDYLNEILRQSNILPPKTLVGVV